MFNPFKHPVLFVHILLSLTHHPWRVLALIPTWKMTQRGACTKASIFLKNCMALFLLRDPLPQKNINLLKWFQQRTTNLSGGMEHLLYKERLRELAIFSTWKRDWGYIIAVFQYLKGAYMKNGKKLSKRVCGDRTRENGFEMRVGLNLTL